MEIDILGVHLQTTCFTCQVYFCLRNQEAPPTTCHQSTQTQSLGFLAHSFFFLPHVDADEAEEAMEEKEEEEAPTAKGGYSLGKLRTAKGSPDGICSSIIGSSCFLCSVECSKPQPLTLSH